MKIIFLLLLLSVGAGAEITSDAAKAVDHYRKTAGSYITGKRKDKDSSAFDKVKKVLDQLISSNDEKAVKYTIRLISDKNTPPGARGYAMRKAAECGNDALKKAIKKEAAGGRTNAYVVDVLARQKQADCNEIFGKYISSKDRLTQMAGLMGLANSGGIKNIALINRIGSTAVRAARQGLRWACCKALGSSLNKAAVPYLIACLDLPGGYKEARHALIRLTGNTQSSGKGEWEKWWKTNHENFKPVDELNLAIETLKNLEGDTEFYGLAIEGNPVVFLLDASNSMKGEQWERLLVESRQMLESLPYEIEFAIIMFPLNTFPKRGYVNNQSENAITFVRYIELKLSTPMANAIYVALNNHMNKGKNLPDTIYLLTDGRPTDAKADDEYDCILLGLFPGNCVRINTVCIGKSSPMLENIAKEHGGKSVTINAGGRNEKKKKKK